METDLTSYTPKIIINDFVELNGIIHLSDALIEAHTCDI